MAYESVSRFQSQQYGRHYRATSRIKIYERWSWPRRPYYETECRIEGLSRQHKPKAIENWNCIANATCVCIVLQCNIALKLLLLWVSIKWRPVILLLIKIRFRQVHAATTYMSKCKNKSLLYKLNYSSSTLNVLTVINVIIVKKFCRVTVSKLPVLDLVLHSIMISNQKFVTFVSVGSQMQGSKSMICKQWKSRTFFCASTLCTVTIQFHHCRILLKQMILFLIAVVTGPQNMIFIIY